MTADALAPNTLIANWVLMIDGFPEISIGAVSPVEPDASLMMPVWVPSTLTPLTFAVELAPASPKFLSLSTRDNPIRERPTVPPVTVAEFGVVPRFHIAIPRSNWPPAEPTMLPFK